MKLGYEDLDVKKVMLWYEMTTAPFREGKKRKEFPDAFSIAMLEAYAAKEKLHVAVVSADPDFKEACQRFNCLLHFQSLPRLTELLLSEDARVEKMRSAIDAQIDVLLEATAERCRESATTRPNTDQSPGEITERDDVELEGTAKVSFDDQGKVSAVTLVSFNETEVRLRASPWRRW